MAVALMMYVDRHQQIEEEKNRILAELEFCYEQVENPKRGEMAKNMYRRKIRQLEKMFNVLDEKGEITVEDLI